MNTSRQNKIVDIDTINMQHPIIIGVGAVGRVVAETLTCNGVPQITICDFDTVEDHNKTTQGYFHDDIGKYKVDCVAEHLLRINPDLKVNVANCKFRMSTFSTANKIKPITAVFSCVDSLTLRGKIFELLRRKEINVPIFDARLGGELVRLISAFDEKSDTYYPETITSDKTAFSDGCHIPMIKHAANIGASHLVQMFMSHISNREIHIDRFIPLVMGTLISDMYEKHQQSKDNSNE